MSGPALILVKAAGEIKDLLLECGKSIARKSNVQHSSFLFSHAIRGCLVLLHLREFSSCNLCFGQGSTASREGFPSPMLDFSLKSEVLK